jgi:hypothetical protein
MGASKPTAAALANYRFVVVSDARVILAVVGVENIGRGGPQDGVAYRARVAGGQKHEVSYEAKKTGRSASAVKKAVKKVGNARKKVERKLGR